MEPQMSVQLVGIRRTDRIYGIRFAGFEIKFQVQGDHLTVVAILPLQA